MEVISEAAAERFGEACGSGAAGLVGGVLATLTSVFVGAAVSAASVLREAGGSACLLAPVACGFGLCFVVTLVPPEPERRRVQAFLALCTPPAAIGLAYWSSGVD